MFFSFIFYVAKLRVTLCCNRLARAVRGVAGGSAAEDPVLRAHLDLLPAAQAGQPANCCNLLLGVTDWMTGASAAPRARWLRSGEHGSGCFGSLGGVLPHDPGGHRQDAHRHAAAGRGAALLRRAGLPGQGEWADFETVAPCVSTPVLLPQIVREEGVSSLYRALPPRLLSVVPMTGIQYGVYELVKRLLVGQPPSGVAKAQQLQQLE